LEKIILSIGIILTFFTGYYQQPIKAIGTGFILIHNNEYYVVTCRHVVDSERLSEFGIKINVGNKASDEARKTIILDKKGLLFHYTDTILKTYDLAVFRIGLSREIKSKLDPHCLMIELNYKAPKLKYNDSLYACGFKTDNLVQSKIDDNKTMLKPYLVKGTFLHSDSNEVTKTQNYFREVKDQYYMKVEQNFNWDGMSGGLVFTLRENVYYPIGIITSGGNGSYAGEEVNYIGFTHISRLLQMLANQNR